MHTVISYINPSKFIFSISSSHQHYAEELFIVVIKTSCLRWALNLDMFSVYCSNAVWKIPNVKEIFSNTSPRFYCWAGKIDWLKYVPDNIASFNNYFIGCRFSNSESSCCCIYTVSMSKKPTTYKLCTYLLCNFILIEKYIKNYITYDNVKAKRKPGG